jgi:dTDP-4-amino-4,6-dideoxy-D-galactose acyltransferase
MNKENQETNEVIYLDWDSNFFGIPIGRIYANGLTGECLRKRLEGAKQEKIKFIELFCDASDHESIDSSERLGFHLADLRISLKKNLEEDIKEDRSHKDLIFKKADKADINRLKTISKGLFKDSRYYRYQKFDKDNIDLMFQIWIEKSVLGEFDDELYCLSNEMDILAFCSLRYKVNAASIGLFGINSAYRGKGLGNLILKRVFHLLYKRQITDVAVITQGKNSSALHLYQKNGFCVSMITLCYYKWLE